MAYKDFEIKKLYYSIGEAAEILGVNTSLIRYWETEFDIIKPKKNAKGDRIFREKDIENLQLIYHLVKEKGFTLDGAKKQLKTKKKPLKNNQEIIASLTKIKTFLEDLKNEL